MALNEVPTADVTPHPEASRPATQGTSQSGTELVSSIITHNTHSPNFIAYFNIGTSACVLTQNGPEEPSLNAGTNITTGTIRELFIRLKNKKAWRQIEEQNFVDDRWRMMCPDPQQDLPIELSLSLGAS